MQQKSDSRILKSKKNTGACSTASQDHIRQPKKTSRTVFI